MTTVATRPEGPASGMPAARDSFSVGAGLTPTVDRPSSMPTAERFSGAPGKPSLATQVDTAMRQVSPSSGTKIAASTPAGAQPGIDKALRDATTAKLASQYSQYRTPTNYQQVRTKMQTPVAQAPVTPDIKETVEQNIAEVAQPAPANAEETAAVGSTSAPAIQQRAKAYDVYSGLASEAMDNTGQNKVSTP